MLKILLASRSSIELHTLLFFKGKILQEDAYVIKVKVNGFRILIPKFFFIIIWIYDNLLL